MEKFKLPLLTEFVWKKELLDTLRRETYYIHILYKH